MTISSENRKAGPFAGSGSVGPFSFTFKVFQASDVLVVKFNTITNVEQTLTLTSDYTVSLNSDQNVSPGGTVTLTSALATGYNLALSSQVQSTQETDLTNQGGFYPEVITAALDKLTIVNQQNDEALSRSVKTSLADTRTGDQLRDDLFAAQLAAANSASAASSSQSAALASQNAAAVSETNAATSAAAAAAAAASGLYSAVQDKSADYTVVLADAGDLFRVTTTSAPVTITLPNIASPMLDGFKVAVAKFSADVNIVSVTSATGQLISGSGTYALDVVYEMATFVADLETQTWFAVGNGTNIASEIYENFNGTGAQTVFTLTNDPGISNAVDIYINGVYQQKNQYTLTGTTLTFNEAPPKGTTNIEARYALPIPIGTPSNNTVSTIKLQDSAVTTAKIANNAVDGTKINLASNTVGDMMVYNGADWVRFPKPGTGYSAQVLRHGWLLSAPVWTTSTYTEGVGLNNVTNYQYTFPTGYRFARVFIWGAGGGGGSGQWQTTVATACGGGGGGGSGAFVVMEFSLEIGNYNPILIFNGGAAGTGGIGSVVMGTPGTAGGAGGALTVQVSDTVSTATAFTVAAGGGGGAGSATAGAAGSAAAATSNTAPLSFLLVAAGLAGGAGALGARGANGATATTLLQPPGGGGGAGLAATGNTSFVGGNSSPTWVGHNRVLTYDQVVASSSGDGTPGGSGATVFAHLGSIAAMGASGGNSGTTATSAVADGGSGSFSGFGSGGGGGGGTRGTYWNRGSNGGDGAGASMLVICW
jgi:hypothetical protein